MQTKFSTEQLQDPRLADAERILRRCVHCGLCTAVCSTYVLLGDERDSPRGRIWLMKDMFETGRDPSLEVRTHIDRCLSCLSCTTTCPSGVDYMHLVDHARAYIEERTRRSFRARLMRGLLARIVPYPRRFRLAMMAAPLARPFRGLMRRVGLKELATMVDMVPASLPARAWRRTSPPSPNMRRGRLLMLEGCAQQVLRPTINESTDRLLTRSGFEVVVARGAGCCGALVHHLGREHESLAQVKRNVDAFTREIERAPVDAILITASGCGTMVKDYGHLLKDDPDYAVKAKRVSEMTRDVSEFIAAEGIGPPLRWSSIKVAYHSACSLQHGQRITDEPRTLLSQAGFTVVDVPEGHICCGSAGTYNILQPEIAAQLRDRKVANIRSTRPDVVAAGNIGCITHLAQALDVPIVHTAELLDWAYGGPVPRGLEHLEPFVASVPQPSRKPSDDIEA